MLCLLLSSSQWWTHVSSVACHDSFQDTGIFFIALEKPGRNIYVLLLMLSCKLSGHPPRTIFMVPSHHVLWLVQIHNWCPWCPLHMLTLSRRSTLDQGIHPLDVLVRAWCRWATSSAFIRYTCSSLPKAFYPLVDLSLIHGACSILCQHLVMEFRRFNPLCPQKMH
jgi:hypothetical protein